VSSARACASCCVCACKRADDGGVMVMVQVGRALLPVRAVAQRHLRARLGDVMNVWWVGALI
jgi:hypothetical protein